MKYKVWDKVKYLKNTTNNQAIIWEEYFITEIDDYDEVAPYSLWKLKWEYENSMWVREDDIELVELEEEFKVWEEVYVSDESIEDAITSKQKRIYLYSLPWNAEMKYICVDIGDEEDFINWKDYSIETWRYITKITKEEIKSRTIDCTDSKWEEIKDILKLN